VPEHQTSLFSGVVGELIKFILQGKEEAWRAFLLLSRLVLALPRSGRRVSRQVGTFLKLFSAGEWEALLSRNIHYAGEAPLDSSYEKKSNILSACRIF